MMSSERMDRVMTANELLSIISGFFFGLISYPILLIIQMEDAALIAVTVGLSFGVLLYLFLTVYGKIMNKRYAAFEKEISSPIFYKTNGNFDLGNGKSKNGNIYFCEAGIVFACLEEKPYAADEILLKDIDRYQMNDTHLNVFAKDGRVFVISLSDAQKVREMLREKNWIYY